jgi:hypothetical protein
LHSAKYRAILVTEYEWFSYAADPSVLTNLARILERFPGVRQQFFKIAPDLRMISQRFKIIIRGPSSTNESQEPPTIKSTPLNGKHKKMSPALYHGAH